MTRSTAPGARIGIVLKGYPRLSETFIAQEIHALEQRGFALTIFSLRRPTDGAMHPIHGEIAAPVVYLPEYLYQEPRRVWRAWQVARRLPGYRAARASWLADLARDRSASRGRRFGQALVLAAELPPDIVHLHAHFLHTPTSVTRYAAQMRGLAFSVSAHAKDIWTTPAWDKREKIADCDWLTTCTRANAEHLRTLAPSPDRVDLAYHGLDLTRFPPPPEVPANADPRRPVTLLTVGRAVEKKGFDDLLAALARLPAAPPWRLVHVGDGPLRPRLQALADTLGIADRVSFRGALPQQEVLSCYRAADLFVLPSRVVADGDRDGLPNVLMEAQSQRLACVATAISGIPELIEDGVTGLLVPERDRDALAAALARLIGDPVLRRRLGNAGFERTRRDFTLDAGLDRIAARLSASLAAAASPAA
ncbi:MAG: glycosyltransferase family 4 protein [Rubrivivax sp.]|nr:glycosyltransferase family 4 protein [Rubrivivax sp.]